MDFTAIKPKVIAYLERLQKHIHVSQALVYGSFAQGKASTDSDVDLLIISEDFGSLDEDKRSRLLYRASVGFPYDLHVYGLTSSEYKNASPLTTLGAIRQSKTIQINV